MLVPKELRKQKWQRWTAGVQEVSIKNSGPEEGPRTDSVLMVILPAHRRKKPRLTCVHVTGSGSPRAILCLAVKLKTTAFICCPRRLKYWEIWRSKWPGRAGNLASPAKSTCVVQGQWNIPLVGKFLLQMAIPRTDLPISRDTTVSVSYYSNIRRCLSGRTFMILLFK